MFTFDIPAEFCGVLLPPEVNIDAVMNAVLSPTAATIDTADPTDLSAYFRINPVDALILGTDIIGTGSIDGGTTDAVGTWTEIGAFDSEILYRLDIDVSAQAGSSLVWEITNANNKRFELHACGGVLPIY